MIEFTHDIFTVRIFKEAGVWNGRRTTPISRMVNPWVVKVSANIGVAGEVYFMKREGKAKRRFKTSGAAKAAAIAAINGLKGGYI